MSTREALRSRTGDRQGQDGMVQVRRDQGALLLVTSDLLRGRSVRTAIERDGFVGSWGTARKITLCRARCELRTAAHHDPSLPHICPAL
jgi:hypothetical protein